MQIFKWICFIILFIQPISYANDFISSNENLFFIYKVPNFSEDECYDILEEFEKKKEKRNNTKYLFIPPHKKFVMISNTGSKIRPIYDILGYANEKGIKNIPKTLSFFKKDNVFFLMYSFCNGYPLRQEQAEKHFSKILRFLFYLDKILYFHNDLNYQNIIYDEKKSEINVIDFNAYSAINDNGDLEINNIHSSNEPSNIACSLFLPLKLIGDAKYTTIKKPPLFSFVAEVFQSLLWKFYSLYKQACR